MNKYLSTRGFGKGVSPWISMTVLLAVLALIFTVLPSMTTARADETDADNLTISEIADNLEISTDPILIEEAEAPATSGDEGGTGDADPGLEDTVSTLDDALGMLAETNSIIRPMAIYDLVSNLQFRVDGGVVGDPIYVGDNVEFRGTWDASRAGVPLVNGDQFIIDFEGSAAAVSQVIDLNETRGGATWRWGQCVPSPDLTSYTCTIDNIPAGAITGGGDFFGSARVIAENSNFGFQGRALDIDLAKRGTLLTATGQGEAPGTAVNYAVNISSDNWALVDTDVVLVDTFDSQLTLCTDPNLQFLHPFNPTPTLLDPVVVGNQVTFTIERPANGFGSDDPSSDMLLSYRLCTASGGLDPVGTEYNNTITSGGATATSNVRQWLDSGGSAYGVNRGSFALTKDVTGTPPAGFDPLQAEFTVLVEEYVPGGYEADPDNPEGTYTVTVSGDGTPVTGLSIRPDGWTIRLSEVTPPAVPGHTWDTPVFSGAGVTTGTFADGRPFALIQTTQNGNVEVALNNFIAPDVPEIGTTAQVQGSSTNILSLNGGTVVDTVRYENLKPNTDYTLDGEIVAVAADGTVTATGITASGAFTTPDAPAGQLTVSGTTEVTFTITAAQAAAWANQTLVVYETLFEVGVDAPVAEHRNPNDANQTFWVDEPTPEIGTLAQVSGPNVKLLPLTGGEVVDTVSYSFLAPETEYRLAGELMHVDGATVTGTGITAEGIFTTPAAPAGQLYVSGTTEVTFTINAAQAAQYGGQNLVVFEELYLVATGELIADHKDETDADQTFRVEQPGVDIGTSAATNGPTTKLLPLTGGEVVDTVSYTNLDPETEYRLEGELMHVDGTTVTGTGITAEATFTTPVAPAGEFYVSGTTLVVFTITADEAAQYGGQDLVVFEDLYLVATGELVAEHTNPNDQLQTFTIERPEINIGTLAQVQDGGDPKLLPNTGGEVVDTVSYTNLDPETEYRLEGELMHVDGTTVTGTGITAEGIFTTPAAQPGEFYVSGTTEVTFTITGDQAYEYGGQNLVVFEELYLVATGELIAEHKDENDEDQTFRVEDRTPEIGTRADVTGTTTKVLPITGGQVVDTVSYTDLFPETEYRLEGELMHVDGATVTPTGITAEATFTTPAAPAGERYVSGTAQVTFTITAAQAVEYAGEKLVVFEELFDATTGQPVAEHKEPEDEDQSFDIEPGGEIIVDKTVTGPKGDEVENDDEAVFQIRANWLDLQGNEQSRTFNVVPGEPVNLVGLPLNTEITLTEVGANTSVGNVKWGDIVWSGEGVVDEPGASPSGVITITDPDAPIQVGLENKTGSSALIIIPIPLPLVPIGGGSSVPPAPIAPTPTTPAEAAPLVPEVSPKDGIQPPSPKDGIQPQRGAAPMAQQGAAPQAQRSGLASTGADVIWLAGGGIMILLLGTWLVLRGRRNES
ncbi:hypothetical protein [Corynebacterium efficiens YS-314]|uniref:Gram-positive cocci surface proteins LPxTG domain-containing protein n=2 Tax=Corynebacterium efficiens TaxID=152794 RepID=Q8FU04_COREF|nr:hypothetical protein [Corynebacterium efficiens YS-314]